MEEKDNDIKIEKQYNSWGGARPGAGRKKKEIECVTPKMKRQSTCIRLDADNYAKLIKLCKKHNLSQSDMVNEIINKVEM